MKLKIIVIVMGILTGCTTHKGFVNYEELGVYASSTAGNVKFHDVGPVSTAASSWVWKSCDSVALDAIRELLDMAKTRGANTVYKITFDTDQGSVSTPTCYRRWGWFFPYVLPGFGPWMTATSVEGIAAVVEKKSAQVNEIYIPFGADTASLAEKYLSLWNGNLQNE